MLLPFSVPPDQWKEPELLKMRGEKIKEYQRLEFKRELKLGAPQLNRELLKDVTAMANSNGGVIIYGIDETIDENKCSVAGPLTPLSEPDLADKANRIIWSGVSPSVQVYFTSVDVAGGYCLIAFIPESYNKPHAIVQKNKSEYYIRRNQDNVPMTETEIRQLYMSTAQAKETINQRYSKLEKIQFEPAPIGGWAFTCMPIISNQEMASTLAVNREKLNSNYYFDWFNGTALRPFVDRFEAYNLGTNFSFALRLFQSGDITYTTGVNVLPMEPIPLAWVLADWIRAIRYYSEVYSALGYWGPIRLWLETSNLNNQKLQWTTINRRKYNFERERILVWLDAYVDDLAPPQKICIPFVRYFMQACRQDWTEEQAESWVKSQINY